MSDLEMDTKIETHRESCTKSFVSWQIFAWAMGLLLIIFGVVFSNQSALANKVDVNQDTVSSIKTDVATIKEAVTWLKDNQKR